MFRMPQLSRRDWMKVSAFGALGTSMSGWFPGFAARAAETAKEEGTKHKSCILLWMNGGPSQAHTFDLKPGGDYKAIPTSVPGIEVSEHLPKVAKQMEHMAVLRGMSTGESEHRRAMNMMHSGFRPGGAIVYPSLGSVIAKELGDPMFELPNFVSLHPSSFANGYHTSGYLGPKFAPMAVYDVTKGVENLKPTAQLQDLDARSKLLAKMDKGYQDEYQANPIESHQKGYEKAMQLIHSAKSKAFDLSQEPASVRAAYGNSRFGDGCIVARRLVQAGVPFVELSDDGKIWDTHTGAAGKVKDLCKPVDPAWAALIADLKDRNLLDDTLVIWMGEFGRSPGGGKNHFARAWSTVLCGAGLKTGQVVGKTDKSGGTVEERPISAGDFMATVLKAVGIEPSKKFKDKGGRPIALVDKGGEPVKELFA